MDQYKTSHNTSSAAAAPRLRGPENVASLRIEDFDYPLPDERIARHPLAQRDACRLIEAAEEGPVSHYHFSDLPALLKSGTLMIANETKVINARMEFFKPSGGRIEVFLLEPFSPADYVISFAARNRCIWTCMIGNLKRWKSETLKKSLTIPGIRDEVTLSAQLQPLDEGETPSASRRVEFAWDNELVTFADIVEAAGNIPIPPYLKRDTEPSDLKDYQTVYSRVEGSVAAPTAGLHFTPQLLRLLEKRGVKQEKVILHVGAGTFQPVKSEHIGDHPMHTESVAISRHTIREIIAALKEGRDILAVGTTSVRTIESLPLFGYLIMKGADIEDPGALHVSQWEAYDENYLKQDTLTLLQELEKGMEMRNVESIIGSTAIMIAPGFKWRIVNRMVTNFHQPQSTLLLLVGSFLGETPENIRLSTEKVTSRPRWRRIYDEALAGDYRFLSYGDACLFSRNTSSSNHD